MSEQEVNIHVLDAAYKPFPAFEEWASKTSVDTVRWDRYSGALKENPGTSSEALKRAREIVKRAAALDTGAIEGLYEVDRGFTFSVAFETAAWETELAKKGENVRPLFEAQLHAYDYVLDLATKAEPISEAAIRVLHEEVCKAQQTYRVMTAVGPQEQKLVKGRYKVLPNHVRTRDGIDHSYAPVDVTPEEMQRLVYEMRSEAFLASHPVMQAAYAHYGLVVIHPFPDGNGRVARALASAFTYRAISMPIMILSEQKNAYLDALEAADKGEPQRFLEFMLARTLDTMTLVTETLRSRPTPDPEESLAAIDGFYSSRGGYTREQISEIGYKLTKLLDVELKKAIERSKSARVHGGVDFDESDLTFRGRRHPHIQEGDRYSEGGRSITVKFEADPPLHANVTRQFDLFLPKDPRPEDDVQLQQFNGNDTFSARVEEVFPSTSGVLQIRAAIFAERVVSELLAELRSKAQPRHP